MVLRQFILFILLIVLPDLYIDYRFLRPLYRMSFGRRLLWWIPCMVMMVMTCWMANQEDFIPRNYLLLEGYMLLLGVLVIPKFLFSLCSAIGWSTKRLFRFRSPLYTSWFNRAGFIVAFFALIAFLYGFTLGFNQLRVKHVELSFRDLPADFDGFRIVHVSDLHVGSYGGWRRYVLHQVVDSIEAQQADLICFTGDLQNTRPEEVLAVKAELSRLPNVVSVMGNHDYSKYAGVTDEEGLVQVERMRQMQRDTLDWVLLDNANVNISEASGSPKIYIAGTENDGKPPFPSYADYKKAMKGIPKDAFTIMLQHDPSAWERHILPQTSAQLTLSGHTHGGQIRLMGGRPTQLTNRQDYGVYAHDDRYLCVSGGVGGVVPFRLGMPGEITVITLKRMNN